MTDLYVEKIIIVNNDGEYYKSAVTTASISSLSKVTDVTTISEESGTMSNITSTTAAYGLKFTIQLINRKGSSIPTDDLNKYRVEVCTRSIYSLTVDNVTTYYTEQIGDINIQLAETSSLSTSGSLYIGHNLAINEGGNDPAITTLGTWSSASSPVYIPDQYQHNTTFGILSTDFILQYLTTVNSDALVIGKSYTILAVGSGDWTTVGAAANTTGTTFTATATTTSYDDGTATIWISKQFIGRNSNSTLVSATDPVTSITRKYFKTNGDSQVPSFLIDSEHSAGLTTGNSNGNNAINQGVYNLDIGGSNTATNTSPNNYRSFNDLNYSTSFFTTPLGDAMYIDSVSILNNSGSYFKNVTTTASLSSFNEVTSVTTAATATGNMSFVTSTTSKYGLKFLIQIVNRSGLTISPGEANNYRVKIDTKSFYGSTIYDEDEDEYTTTKVAESVGDIYIRLPETSISNADSVYLGHNTTVSDIGTQITAVGTWENSDGTALSTSPVYIPDQYKHNTLHGILATIFTLQYNNGVGWNNVHFIGKNDSTTLTESSGNIYFKTGSISDIPSYFIDYNDNSLIGGVGITTGNSNGDSALENGTLSLTIIPTIDPNNFKLFNMNNYGWRSQNSSAITQSIVGDPHIKTLDGEYYEFDYLGSFRLLEDTINGEKLIINGKAEPGPARWKTNQYIKKLFIQKGENYILIDMGFRGEEVTVLEEKGFIYTEKELDFHKDAKRYSLTSRYKTTSRTEPVTEDLPRLIRNKINFTIDDNNKKSLIFFEISNVNEYNLQPCRLHIKLDTYNVYSKNAKGCLISRLHAPASKLNDIKSCEPIDLLSLKDMDEIPELEINPILRNKQWN